jgi:iron complex transport system substrate-binding protein
VRHAICGAIVLARTGLGVWFKCLPVLVLGVSSCFAQESVPKNIVSLSLCTDQLLLMLVPRQHIASVTRGAIDPHLSYMAATADGLVLNSGGIEEVLPLKPDLIVGSAFASRDAVRFLRYLGYPVKLIGLPQSIAEIREMVLSFGAWVGYHSRAKQLVEKMDGQLAHLNKQHQGVKKTALIYSPNGYTMGSGTLENTILKAAGFDNLAIEMGVVGFEQITLERLVAAQPDFLFIEKHVENPNSLASHYVSHPVLKKMSLSQAREFIPSRLRACAGPMVVEAIEFLVGKRNE